MWYDLILNLILKIFIIEDQQISNFAVLLEYDFWRQDDIVQSIKRETLPLLSLTEFYFQVS